MKQQGKSWVDAEGNATLVKFLPAFVKLAEKNGQKIAAIAQELELKIREQRELFLQLASEVFRNNPDQSLKTQFSFYTYDREYRIEYNLQELNVKVYRATCKNPKYKDYAQVNMDMSKFDHHMIEAMHEVLVKEMMDEAKNSPENQNRYGRSRSIPWAQT